MTFLTVLLALFVERVSQHHRPARRYRWFDGYCRRLAAVSFFQWLMARPWGALLALLPMSDPDRLAAAVHARTGQPVRARLRCVHPIVQPRAARPRARCRGLHVRRATPANSKLRPSRRNSCVSARSPVDEPRRSFAVARAVVVLATRRLIGPIFWFVVFGPVGAAAYRMIHLLAERLQTEQCPQEMQKCSDEMRHVADWAPARTTRGRLCHRRQFRRRLACLAHLRLSIGRRTADRGGKSAGTYRPGRARHLPRRPR